MSVSPERFESFVRAAAANRHKVVGVAVDGFNFTLKLKARRQTYEVLAEYNPTTGQWVGIDRYMGGLIRSVIDDVARAIKEDRGA